MESEKNKKSVSDCCFERKIIHKLDIDQLHLSQENDIAFRDFEFLGLFIRKQRTYELLEEVRQKVDVDHQLQQPAARKDWIRIREIKESIISILSEKNVHLKLRYNEISISVLKQKNNNCLDHVFSDYLDSQIGNLTLNQIFKLDSAHYDLNILLNNVIGSAEYDRASHG
jgi:hypothetical protein